MENENLNTQAPAAQPAARPEPPRTSQTRFWLKLIAVLYVLSLVSAAALISKGDVAKKSRPAKMSKFKELVAVTSKDAVAVVPIFGAIYQTDSSKVWERGSQQVAKRIKSAAARKDVKAIILDINSPGGSVGAVQEIYSAILKAKSETKKPFVARFGDISASGGYYVASACDLIYAQPGTITGSIGVIFNVSNLEGLLKKIGVKSEAIKSGRFKDIGSPMREMTEDERKLLKGLIEDSYDQFVTAVSEGRKMPMDRVKALADGRIFTGRQAMEVKLVDKLGDLEDAINAAGEMAKIGKNPRVVRDIEPLDQFFSMLESKFNMFGGIEQVMNSGPRLEYRWYGL